MKNRILIFMVITAMTMGIIPSADAKKDDKKSIKKEKSSDVTDEQKESIRKTNEALIRSAQDAQRHEETARRLARVQALDVKKSEALDRQKAMKKAQIAQKMEKKNKARVPPGLAKKSETPRPGPGLEKKIENPPKGWSEGKKKGWEGEKAPPGMFQKFQGLFGKPKDEGSNPS